MRKGVLGEQKEYRARVEGEKSKANGDQTRGKTVETLRVVS